jgi:uncharacterized RDD family membrane protein YckC
MKCPKCHYLSFEPSPRCRNCGFDLGIAEVDVAIRPAEASDAPAADLELHPKRRASARRSSKTLGLVHPARDVESPREPASAVAVSAPVAFQEVPLRIDLDPPAVVGLPRREPVRVAAPAPPAPPKPQPQAPPQTPGELPLFVKGLLSGPARPPLAVRRAAPELVRPKPQAAAPAPAAASTPPRPPGAFDADLIEDLRRMEAEENKRLRAAMTAQARVDQAPADEVGRFRRLLALGADWAILAGVGTMILWASLRVADARVEQLGLAAIVPLTAFLALIGFAYFLLFTAGNGQTPGKMALHIRVVDATAPDAAAPPTPRQALHRTLLAAASGALLGVGFLPALGERGVAAPDRFTQTRTIRA